MKKKGFTLVELIAVIVILAILVSVGVPVYMRIRDSILQTQYENTVSRIETAAEQYASDANSQDVVDVNVQFLIENGYISADDEYAIYDPRDDSSMNCFMVHVVIENGNYVATMDESPTTDDDGTCSMYVSVGDYQIYCTLNGYTSECSSSWYNDNVELTLYKGSELVTSSDIEWTSQLGVYEISNSVTTSAIYLMSTTYIATYKEDGTTYKVSQVIKIDKENPVINEITYKNSTDSWVQSNTMYISASDRDGSGIFGYALVNSTDDCSVANYQSDNSIDLTNGSYKVCVMDNVGNIVESEEIDITNIDDTGPEINLSYSPTSWTTEVTLTFDASDSESGVRGYAITTTNEQPTVYINANRTSEYTTWSGTSTDVTETENATYYLWVVDNVGNVSSKSVEITNIDRVTPAGSISVTKKSSGTTVSSGSWSNEGLNFTITTNTCGISGCTIYYCVDTANTCTPSTVATSGSQITSYNTKTGTYYIRYYIISGAGVSSTVTSYTAKVDTTLPTASVSATSTNTNYNTLKVDVKVTGSDSGSGVASVCVQESNDSSECTWYSGSSKTVQFTASDEYDGTSKTYYAFAKDNAGNISSVVSTVYKVYNECSNSNYQKENTIDSCTVVIDTITSGTCSVSSCKSTFEYTGGEQTYTVPYDGYYKIQAYGTKGGTSNGGNGGYAEGVFYLTAGTTLYINVGGAGSAGSGGYNGGGTGGSNEYNRGGGGGATHVATKSGLLSSLSSSTSSILIVAAGGGGGTVSEGTCNTSAKGGAGGGTTGESGKYSTSSGGGYTWYGAQNAVISDGTYYSCNTSGRYCSGATGISASNNWYDCISKVAGGGSQTAGGAGGVGWDWMRSYTGNAGSFGKGGDGSAYQPGGGAGYYGGGAAGVAGSYTASGGGGSNYIASKWNSKDVTSTTNTQGCSSCTGDGKVIITSTKLD